jgi:hypothetical protein
MFVDKRDLKVGVLDNMTPDQLKALERALLASLSDVPDGNAPPTMH